MAKKVSNPKAETTEEKSEEVEEVKEVKQPEESVEVEEQKPVENSLPKFKNNGKAIKINLGKHSEPNWITVKNGETVTIPKKIALANKLEEVK